MKNVFTALVLAETTVVAGMIAAFFMHEPPVTWLDAVRPPQCAVTSDTLVLAHIFGPIPGESPVWFVTGSTGVWHRREPVKTILVLARTTAGSLRLHGHRLDGPGELAFQRDVDGDIARALEIVDPWHDSMRPGGPSVMQMYAFVPMYVYYPSAGCWELIARVGDRTVRIVTLLKTEVAAAFDRHPQ